MSMSDIKRVTLSPQAAANALHRRQNDAAQTYEPYMSRSATSPSPQDPAYHQGLPGGGRHSGLSAHLAARQSAGRGGVEP